MRVGQGSSQTFPRLVPWLAIDYKLIVDKSRWHLQGPRESRGGQGKRFHVQKNFQLINYLCRHGQLMNGVTEFFYTNCEIITNYSTQAFTHWVQTKQKTRKQCEDAAHKGKNNENKSLTGPLKSLGAPGKYLPPSSRWAWTLLQMISDSYI